jgi:hypothetical protein
MSAAVAAGDESRLLLLLLQHLHSLTEEEEGLEDAAVWMPVGSKEVVLYECAMRSLVAGCEAHGHKAGTASFTASAEEAPLELLEMALPPSNSVSSLSAESAMWPAPVVQDERPLPAIISPSQCSNKQGEYAVPWEHGEVGQAGRAYDSAGPAFDEARAREPGDKARNKFTAYVRKANIKNQDVNGNTRAEKYGQPKSDLGHITIAYKNGGSNTLANSYMQDAPYNQGIGKNQDELNCAFVGCNRSEKAVQDSRKYGQFGGFNSGPHKGKTSEDLVNQGAARFKAVGLLMKKEGFIDKRSRAVKRGEVTFDEHGRPLGLKEKAQEIRRNILVAASTKATGKPQRGKKEVEPAAEAKATAAANDELGSMISAYINLMPEPSASAATAWSVAATTSPPVGLSASSIGGPVVPPASIPCASANDELGDALIRCAAAHGGNTAAQPDSQSDSTAVSGGMLQNTKLWKKQERLLQATAELETKMVRYPIKLLGPTTHYVTQLPRSTFQFPMELVKRSSIEHRNHQSGQSPSSSASNAFMYPIKKTGGAFGTQPFDVGRLGRRICGVRSHLESLVLTGATAKQAVTEQAVIEKVVVHKTTHKAPAAAPPPALTRLQTTPSSPITASSASSSRSSSAGIASFYDNVASDLAANSCAGIASFYDNIASDLAASDKQ